MKRLKIENSCLNFTLAKYSEVVEKVFVWTLIKKYQIRVGQSFTSDKHNIIVIFIKTNNIKEGELAMASGKNIAYIRVSTIDQNDGRQKEAMKNYNIEKCFIETASAKDASRPVLLSMLDYVREGDTIYIKDFSRLARSAKDLLAIVDKLQVKSVNLVSLKENFDTTTPTGKLMLTMFGAIYEFERTNLLERQREGIELAKRAGKYKGRKQILLPSNWGCVYSEWKQRNLTAKAAMVQLGLKPNTFYRFVSETRAKEAQING